MNSALIFLISGAVTLLLRIVNLVPMQKALWDRLPSWVKYIVVFTLTAAGSALSAIHSGTPWMDAVFNAISAGFGASGLHVMTEKMGDTHTAMAVKSNPDYQPGILRKIASIVVPINKDMIKPTAP